MTVDLAYVTDGPPDAPVLVLGSSVGTGPEMWEPQVADLARRWRVVRYGHRGHGGSPAPPGPYTIAELGGDVLALVDRLGAQRVSYAGLSLGGMVGMWLAAHHPDRVERLVLVCTAARLGPAQLWTDRAATTRAAGTGAITPSPVLRWFTPEFAAARPEIPERFAAGLAAVDDEGYAGCCEAIGAMDLRGDLGAITAPTMVIAGADDPATPPALGEEIAAAVPGARFELIADAAHLANVQQPEAVAGLLDEHLGGES